MYGTLTASEPGFFARSYKRCGIDSIGVLYGYGTLEELQKTGATYIAEKVADIKNILIDN